MSLFRRQTNKRKTKRSSTPVSSTHQAAFRENRAGGDGLDPNKESVLTPESLSNNRGANPKNKNRPNGYLVLSRSGVVLSGLGLVFILIWVFTLGIMVGRGTIFELEFFQILEKRVTGDRPATSAPVVEVAESAPPMNAEVQASAPELTFYDSLSGNPSSSLHTQAPASALDPDRDSGTPGRKNTARGVVARPPESISSESTPGSLPPGRSGIDPQAVPQAVDLPISETSLPERRPGKHFTVQVAAATDPQQAGRTAHKLRNLGFEAYYYPVEVDSRRYFRIRVGPFETREQASAAMARLKAAGMRDVFIATLTN